MLTNRTCKKLRIVTQNMFPEFYNAKKLKAIQAFPLNY